MKWFYLILTNIMKQLMDPSNKEIINPAEELKDIFMQNILKILLLFASITAVMGLFISGLIITVVNYAFQFDLKQTLHANAVIATGFFMMAISFIAISSMIYFITRDHRLKKKIEAHTQKHKMANPIQEAVVLLINDFVAEREFERDYKRMLQRQHNNEGPMPTGSTTAEAFERH